MNRVTKMMLLNSGRDKEKRRRMGIEYEDWTPQDRHMFTTYDRPPESAFYDNRGRRHYDDGRYAPMRSAYDDPESRGYRRYSDGRFAPRSGYMPMEPWSEGGGDGRMERGMSRDGGYGHQDDPRSYGGSPRMIGFNRDWGDQDMRSDATMPQYREMDQMRGQRSQGGYASSTRLPRFDQYMAQDWVHSMRNADGTKGPHWSMDKVKEIMKEYQVDCDPVEFYAVLNSIYSDFCEVLKENNTSNMKTYVCLAKAWLDDEDAVRDKVAAYFMYIVEH